MTNSNQTSAYADEPELSELFYDECASKRNLGTLGGVFCPVALSIFSALLFLRVGYVVGNAGLLVTLGQYGIAYSLLFLSTFSLCALATTGIMGTGGIYFIIARSLGPELGGTIAAMFTIGNIFSSAQYVIGLVEGLVHDFGPDGTLVSNVLDDGFWWRFLYGSLINIFNLSVCLIGGSMYAHTTTAIFVVVLVCTGSVIVSFFTLNGLIAVDIPETNHLTNLTYGYCSGLNFDTLVDNALPAWGRDYTQGGSEVDFSKTFGVLFSGVTGIMIGANMSGELKNPGSNIPRGTLSALLFTLCSYILIVFLTAGSCDRFLLQNDYIFMMGVDLWSGFITIGIVTATLSASLSNLIGATRILEAVAKDDLFGVIIRPLLKCTTGDNPIGCVLWCGVVLQIILFMGNLNLIAQITSLFFLLAYGSTNLACLGLDLAGAPNFRPNFRYFSWWTAALGLLGNMTMMFVISPLYAALSLLLCASMVILLHCIAPPNNWGSLSQALIFHQVRKYLLLLDSRKDHVKFWRPQMLLMVHNPRSAAALIDFTNDLKKGGLFVLGHVVTDDNMTENAMASLYRDWVHVAEHLNVKAFVSVTAAPSVRSGMQHLVRLSGLGAMRPNTVVFGFYDDDKPCDLFSDHSPYTTNRFDSMYPLRGAANRVTAEEYVCMLQDAVNMSKNIVVCRHFHQLNKVEILSCKKVWYVDAWPVNYMKPDRTDNMDTTCLFLLQLAMVLNMVSAWKRGCVLRVFLVHTSHATDTVCRESRLQDILTILRIKADIVTVMWDDVHSCAGGGDNNITQLGTNYLTKLNHLIRLQSQNTAACFLYMPNPHQAEAGSEAVWLEALTRLTEGLPPAVLVHGVNPVTSTSL